MESAELRKLLNEAKNKEMQLGCAVALSKDKKSAVFDVHRTHIGKVVSAAMKAGNKDIAEPIRFGTAIVTMEEPKLVRLVLNQPLNGIAKKVAKALKGTGFTKVKIGLEDGTELEGADDEEEEGQAAPAAAQQAAAPEAPPPPKPPEPQPDAGELTKRLMALAPRIPSAAGTDDAKKAAWLKLASQSNVYIKTNNLRYAKDMIDQLERELAALPSAPPPPPQAAAPAPDVAALAKQLAELARRIPAAAGTDDAKKAALLKIAGQANVYLKTNNPAYAADTIEALRKELDTGKKMAGPNLETLRGHGRKWLDMRQRVEDGLEMLQATLSATYDGQTQAGPIDASFRTVTAPILRTLDASFATSLEAAGKTEDPSQRDALIGQARQALAGYKAFSATKLLKDLDDNPFAALSLQAGLAETIAGLEAALA